MNLDLLLSKYNFHRQEVTNELKYSEYIDVLERSIARASVGSPS